MSSIYSGGGGGGSYTAADTFIIDSPALKAGGQVDDGYIVISYAN